MKRGKIILIGCAFALLVGCSVNHRTGTVLTVDGVQYEIIQREYLNSAIETLDDYWYVMVGGQVVVCGYSFSDAESACPKKIREALAEQRRDEKDGGTPPPPPEPDDSDDF